MFKECGLIEKYGSGIDRIKRLCKEHRLPEPKFEEMQKGFRVTVYKEKKEDEGINGGINELYTFIEKNGGLSALNLSQNLNKPLRTVQRWIKQLKEQDKIEYLGSKKTGGYYAK